MVPKLVEIAVEEESECEMPELEDAPGSDEEPENH